MSNKDTYKAAMAGVRHSDGAQEKIFSLTTDRKKQNRIPVFKRAASVVLAAVLLVAGGFGINNHFSNKGDDLTVLVAYAEDGKIKVGSASSRKIVKGLYFAPADDKKACEKQRKKAEKDYDEYSVDFEKIDQTLGDYMYTGVGTYEVCDEPGHGHVVAMLYTSSAGNMVASRQDYSNVKSFTVENESEYGLLQFEYSGTFEKMENLKESDVDENNPYKLFLNHKFTITGDELRKSQKELGDYGYMLQWRAVEEVYDSYDFTGNSIPADFKASDIKDKITFTFVNNDGSVEKASVNVTFDSYGHMHLK